eukprot:CAMPEP_0175141214 /NCGR_PEP_ID=MMETSP0087-20121206/11977_1 /TAXON_ID=136419 /ORGANISM="Unknown Unknown, Strain D1" /LENGTH=391 /DNA_ID=CAMNT_0016424597 /DNA_START=106 /DNA_END=1281 /DNA_ORIENTATION=+
MSRIRTVHSQYFSMLGLLFASALASAQEVCDCSVQWEPVCGQNSRTYGNVCALLRCAEGGAVADYRPGECSSHMNIGQAVTCSCGNYYQPVCAATGINCEQGLCTAGTTFFNPCQARCAGHVVFTGGVCPFQGCSSGMACSDGQRCVFDANNGFNCQQLIEYGGYCDMQAAVNLCREPTLCSSAVAQLTPQNNRLGNCLLPQETLSPTPAPVRAAAASTDLAAIFGGVSAAVVSCSGLCGRPATFSSDCGCDAACLKYGDCCSDYLVLCSSDTCRNRCNSDFNAQSFCQCDSECNTHQDCCSDYSRVCAPGSQEGTCVGRCGGRGVGGKPDCFCDLKCVYNKDCCLDFVAQCPSEYDQSAHVTEETEEAARQWASMFVNPALSLLQNVYGR